MMHHLMKHGVTLRTKHTNKILYYLLHLSFLVQCKWAHDWCLREILRDFSFYFVIDYLFTYYLIRNIQEINIACSDCFEISPGNWNVNGIFHKKEIIFSPHKSKVQTPEWKTGPSVDYSACLRRGSIGGRRFSLQHSAASLCICNSSFKAGWLPSSCTNKARNKFKLGRFHHLSILLQLYPAKISTQHHMQRRLLLISVCVSSFGNWNI
jgi:hypothetical protein